MNYKTWLIIIGIAIAGMLAWLFFKPIHITNYPPGNDTILAFGDSLVQGVGASPGHDFVTNLSNQIGHPIINMGVSGNTTADGLARINDVLEQKPGVVILLLGGNDYLKRIPQKETFSNLDKIITILQSNGAVVVLIGVRGGLLSDHFDGSFKDSAKRKGTLFVSNILDGLIGNQTLMFDQVHPNDAGYMKMAEKIYPVLKKALP
jgi:acyl-CoA thioesterase-1